ncbi:hypothetical protein AGMMS4952_17140 [Spirochaetia bacterium]|nr:hypothetical protein AGMMS4952_17140 [Spirochaetia bacterium]
MIKKQKRFIAIALLLLFIGILFPGCEQQTDPRDIELTGTTWIWSGAVLEFKSGSRAEVLNTTYSYTYNRSSRQGDIQTLGAFTVSADFQTLIFPNYNNGGGEAVFTRQTAADSTELGEPMPSLIGTTWCWNSGGYGIRTLRFVSAGVVQFQDQVGDGEPWYDYDYSYIPETKKGIIGTALDSSNSIQSRFTVNSDNTRLIFVQWKSYPHGADYIRLE